MDIQTQITDTTHLSPSLPIGWRRLAHSRRYGTRAEDVVLETNELVQGPALPHRETPSTTGVCAAYETAGWRLIPIAGISGDGGVVAIYVDPTGHHAVIVAEASNGCSGYSFARAECYRLNVDAPSGFGDAEPSERAESLIQRDRILGYVRGSELYSRDTMPYRSVSCFMD